MPIEFRTETGHARKSQKITAVYLDQKHAGHIINYGSMAVLKTAEASRSFPSEKDARRWIEDSYKAANQGPQPKADTRPTASAIAPPTKSPALPARPSFPKTPDAIEHFIYDTMKEIGRKDVMPKGTSLPPLSLDEVLSAGIEALLGPDSRNAGTALQAKRVVINAVIRKLGHYLPAEFDLSAKYNRQLDGHIVAVAERLKLHSPNVVEALARAVVKKPAPVQAAPPPPKLAESVLPTGTQDEQPDYSFPDVFDVFDVVDLFEASETAAESSVESPPPAPPEPAAAPEPPPPPVELSQEVEAPVAAPQPAIPLPAWTVRPAGSRGKAPTFNVSQATEIYVRYWEGETARVLAKEYDVTQSVISRISSGTYCPRADE